MQKLDFRRTSESCKYEKNIHSNNQGINAVRDLWLILQLGDYCKEQRAKKMIFITRRGLIAG